MNQPFTPQSPLELAKFVLQLAGNEERVEVELAREVVRLSALSETAPLDQVARDEVARIYEIAKRDDWHTQLVGSDIRTLCRMALQGARTEIERSTADRCNAAMVFRKDWQEADPEELEPWYSHWVSELTAQGLHAKANIATVLAILSKRLAK